MRLNILATLLVAGVLAGRAPRASAATILTPYAGVVFGSDVTDNPRVYGGSLAFTGDSGVGFEVDFGYSPDFFGSDRQAIPENNLTTLMGNLFFSGRPSGSSRMYLSGGAGLLKPRVIGANDFFEVSRNDFGVNAGGGFILGMSDTLGLRGDVRYFRNIGDPEADNEFDLDFGSFSYWRGTVGLALTF